MLLRVNEIRIENSKVEVTYMNLCKSNHNEVNEGRAEKTDKFFRREILHIHLSQEKKEENMKKKSGTIDKQILKNICTIFMYIFLVGIVFWVPKDSYAAVPVVSGAFTPVDNATGIDPLATLSLTFDQTLGAAGTGNITIYNSGGTVREQFKANDPTHVSISGSAVTIIPRYYFKSGNSYYINIANTCFKNAGAEYFAGILDATTWNFTATSTVTVVQAESSDGFTLAIKSDGSVWSWGGEW